jgi:hypothetical protein
VNVDGTGLTQVTGTSTCPVAANEYCSVLAGISWSPDGERIAYTRYDWYLDYEAEPGQCFECQTPQEVWLVDPDVPGSDAKMPGAVQATSVDWSPDGQKLLISNGGPMYSVKPDGTALTPLGVSGYSPVWSPDGTKIAYQTAVTGTTSSPSHVYTRNADGSNPQLVSSNSYNEQGPDWQPIPQGYPRPKGASPFYASLVPAYQSCAAANRTHGSPLAFPSCSPPARTSSNLTVGTPDANGAAAASVGWMSLATKPGNSGTTADEADVRVVAQITDVRNAGSLTDYTGELGLRLPLRVTDRDNTGAGPATVQDATLGIPIPCAATATTPGATCTAVTTVEAVVPGAVKEGVRSVWELSQLRVDDGGPDGDFDTPGNSLFAVQGIFVP